MIERRLLSQVNYLLGFFPAIAILGPRQVGKTTLARAVAGSRPSLYLDLESPEDLERLGNPRTFLKRHLDKLVVLDEIQRVPELFATLRGLIDEARGHGRGDGRYLILGSAANELMRQTSESLAGRFAQVELFPVTCLESGSVEQLWLRGGLPSSLLAPNGGLSVTCRKNLIRTYLERDIPQLGPRIPAETLRRFWTMLAHNQATLWNDERLAGGLGVSSPTVSRYLDLMVDLMLVRRLPAWSGNVGKRLVKSPKVFVRDSGIAHALLGISDYDGLLGHPVVGGSWEGFVIEQLIADVGDKATPFFYRSATGDEIDLVLESGSRKIAIEIKRLPAISRG